MVASSTLAWRLPTTTKASLKVVGGLVGLMAGIGLLAVLVSRVRSEYGLAVTGLSFLAVFVGYVLGWLAISMLLPRATSDPAVLLPGAVLVGATITGLQAVSQVYLPGRMGRASELYGAIGTTIVTLGWFFILGRVIVIAMCLDARDPRALRHDLAVRVLAAAAADRWRAVGVDPPLLRARRRPDRPTRSVARSMPRA